MKTSKKLKTLTLILVIVLITILSFLGVYKFGAIENNNLVKDYNVGMDLSGKQLVRLEVDTSTTEVTYDSQGNVVENPSEDSGEEYTKKDEPVNKAELLTKDNYKKTYEIIKKRLEFLGIEEYNTRFNEENGVVEVELVNNKLTTYAISAISAQGGFEIVDNDTKEVLLNQSSVENVKISLAENGVQYCMDITLNKDGAQKMRDIANTYVTTTQEVVNDNGETETKTTEKKANIEIDGISIGSVSQEIIDSDGHVKFYFGESNPINYKHIIEDQWLQQIRFH